ncbi:MAG: hypothetical protein V1726_05150 [Methanobacteriota archaeon]
MNKGTILGLILLIGGILIWAFYGLYLGFDEIMQTLDLTTLLIGGIILIGILILIVSIAIDQVKTMKKMKQKIKKEDFEP